MRLPSELLESATYDTIQHIAATATDSELLKMLTRVNRTLPILESSSLYSRIETDIRTNHTKLRDDLAFLAEGGFGPDIDSNLMVWIIGLRTALEFHDFRAMHLQMCMFVIGQRAGLFRITDDKLRLVTTYFHFSLAGNLIDKGLI